MRRNILIQNTLQRGIWHRYTLPDPHASGESVILKAIRRTEYEPFAILSDPERYQPSKLPNDNPSTRGTDKACLGERGASLKPGTSIIEESPDLRLLSNNEDLRPRLLQAVASRLPRICANGPALAPKSQHVAAP